VFLLPRHLTVVRHEGTDQASEPDRLGGQVLTYRIGAGAGRQGRLRVDKPLTASSCLTLRGFSCSLDVA